MIMKNLSLLLGIVFCVQFGNGSKAADLSLKIADKEPPQALDASIRKTLQSKAVQLLDGEKPVYEFWFSAEIPLPSKSASPAKALDAVKQATLLGAVSVSKAGRDYRDDELAAGVYTMRFALQPQDGNHLGTSEFDYFLVLVPAKFDATPDGIADYKVLVRASSRGVRIADRTLFHRRRDLSTALRADPVEHGSIVRENSN